MAVNKISEMDLPELDAMLREYPWSSYIRKIWAMKLSGLGNDQRNEALKDALVFFPNPEGLLIDIPGEEKRTGYTASVMSRPAQRLVVVGGDYFSREDFDTLDNSGKDVVEKFETEIAEAIKNGEGELDEDFEAKYYTETLARVYAQQGFYEKAIEVYEKLILLNPEKSIYFASHIDGLKKNL